MRREAHRLFKYFLINVLQVVLCISNSSGPGITDNRW
jgi:hypothetical protein